MKKSKYPVFEHLLNQSKIQIELEHKVSDLIFDWNRKHRVDYVLSKNGKSLIVEIEGHGSAKSRHTSFAGYHNDLLKYNTLRARDYTLLQFTAIMVKGKPLQVVEFINKWFNDEATGEYLTNFYAKHEIKAKK